MHLAALFLLVSLVGCATVGGPGGPSGVGPSAAPQDTPVPSEPASAPAPEPCPRSSVLNVAAVTDEVVCLLQRYVQIDTTNPSRHERLAADFLADVLHRDGIESQIVESQPGRANLIARLEGERKGGALLLLHHMDVVPAVAEDWSVPPMSGTLRDGYVWGRGSLDNKGGGVAQLVAVLMLKRLGITPPRDIVLLAVADEEAGGGLGARWLVENRPELFNDVGHVLNEGGAILDVGGGHQIYSVEVAQKAPLWLRVTASARGGHGSTPRPDVATHTLLRALGRLEAHRFPVTVLPAVEQVFRTRAAGKPEGQRAKYRNLAASMEDPAFAQRFLAEPKQAALVRNTLSVTVLKAGSKENVLPAEASAVLDLRLLPGQDPAAVMATVREVMAEPSLKLETLLSWEAHVSSSGTPLFAAIEELAHRRDPGVAVAANVIGGFTDCNAFRAHGIACYGFSPVRLTFADLGGLHGVDERLSVEALARSAVDLAELVQIDCSVAGACESGATGGTGGAGGPAGH